MQVRGVGPVSIVADIDGAVTRRITAKYLHGPSATYQAERRARHDRLVVRLRPDSFSRTDGRSEPGPVWSRLLDRGRDSWPRRRGPAIMSPHKCRTE
jgi:hypothetical protein